MNDNKITKSSITSGLLFGPPCIITAMRGSKRQQQAGACLSTDHFHDSSAYHQPGTASPTSRHPRQINLLTTQLGI